jgi:hypothetical protein
MRALAQRGHELHETTAEQRLSMETLLRCDVVHIHRFTTPQMIELAGWLRERGVAIVWDNDDDVTAVPRSNPLYAKHSGLKGQARIAALTNMLRLADVVTTPGAALAERCRELGATEVRMLENYLPRDFAGARGRKHDGVAIMCLAALEHQVDYQRLGLQQTLARLLDAHPELRVVSIGLGLGLRSERYENRKAVPFLDLADELSGGDVGIAPLTDIPWNRARSNVKLKEYAAAGLAWLASPVGPYLGMGEREGGRLVPDDGWHEALKQLIVSARERRKLAKRAAKWVKGEYVERHASRWEQTFTDAIERARDRRPLAQTSTA